MFSSIQQYILLQCWQRGGLCSRRLLDSDYQASRSRAKAVNYKKIVTVSLERLIERGILVGYGIKTKDKLFINKIKLTPLGRKQASAILKLKQPALPLRATRP